ncbi:MAG: polysaccharide biosynthesis/export family protein [Lewinellaceae bacterium]|nr:polysaccharide biosynthesis/export family protein [Lewinellaceae bacterium]
MRHLLPVLVIFSFSSCIAHKDLVTFRDVQFPPGSNSIANFVEVTAQSGDILHITVHSFDLDAAKPFNLQEPAPNMMGVQNTQTLELFLGYPVNTDGNIDFPVIGTVQVAGLTLPQIRQKLVELLRTYLTDAVVGVRFLNFRFTILGEVAKPGTYTISTPRITILEAIGRASDLTPYANRTNVLHIRERNGERTYTRLNLQSSDIFSSPYYYLQQNDILYVEPNRAKTAAVADPASRAITYVTGALSVVTLLIALFK